MKLNVIYVHETLMKGGHPISSYEPFKDGVAYVPMSDYLKLRGKLAALVAAVKAHMPLPK